VDPLQRMLSASFDKNPKSANVVRSLGCGSCDAMPNMGNRTLFMA
jgi:hypothetical protein